MTNLSVRHSIAAGGDAVVRPINAAVLRAGHVCVADGRVPLVTGIAVGRARDLVQSAPVGIDGDGAANARAGGARAALRPCQGWVCLGDQRTRLLGPDSGNEGRECDSLAIHGVPLSYSVIILRNLSVRKEECKRNHDGLRPQFILHRYHIILALDVCIWSS